MWLGMVTVLVALSTPFANAQSGDQGPSANIDSLLLRLADHAKEDEPYVDILNQLGFEYWTVSPSHAMEFGYTALNLAQEMEYASGEAFAYRVIGVAQWVLGRYGPALENLLLSRNHYRNLQDTLGIANCTMNIGLVYSDQHIHDRALGYFREALAAFRTLGKQDRVATTLTKIGTVLTDQADYPQALDHLMRALRIHEQQDFHYGIAEVNNRISLLFLAQNEFTLALEYANRSYRLSEEIGDKEGMVNNLEVLGASHLARREYAQAERYLQQGLALAQELEAPKLQRNLYQHLRDVAQEQNQYQQAYQYFEEYARLKDSVFNEEVSLQIANLQTQQELAEQQQALELAEIERDLSQASARYRQAVLWVLLLGLVLVLGLSIATIWGLRSRLRRNQQILEKNKELNQTRENLQAAELENAQLKSSDLQRELDYKNRELTAYTINFAQKNQLIEELKEQLTQLKPSDSEQLQQVKQLRSLVNNNRNVDRDWEDFRLHFESVHPHFFQRLKQAHPELSNGELKLCALIRLNLSMKETAAILSISPNSVKTARYRLRSKLDLETKDNLMDYLMVFEQPAPTESTL